MSEYVALIPAAGVGARAQLKLAKQFNIVGKKTIIEFAIDPFLKDENCKTIYVVVAEDTEAWQRVALLLGWSTWELGIENESVRTTGPSIKKRSNKIKKRSSTKIKKR